MAQTTTGLRFASALSDAPQTTAALSSIVQDLGQRLAGPADLVVFFASPHHADAFNVIHDTLTATLEARVVLGATAVGVIGVGHEIEQGPGLSVLAATLPGVRLRPFSYDQLDWPAVAASPAALRSALELEDTSVEAILLIADHASTPMVKLLPLMDLAFPGVPVIGGMASGGRQPGDNRLLLNGHVSQSGAIGLVMGGDIRAHCTVSQGCRAIGKPLVITGSQRHLVQELGGRKALAVLQEVFQGLNEEDRQLIETHGLLVGRVIDEYKERFGRGDFLIRQIISLDQESGYLAINDPSIRVGQTIQFHVRDQQTAIEDLQLLLQAQAIHGPAGGGAGGALLFSCNGRGLRLFDHPHAAARMIQESLGGRAAGGTFSPPGRMVRSETGTFSTATRRALVSAAQRTSENLGPKEG